MGKLGSVFADGLRLTQYLHGSYQNGKALDIINIIPSNKTILAPCDVEIKGQYIDKEKNLYIRPLNSDFFVEGVHARLIVPPGKYRAKTPIATISIPEDKYPDHLHICVQVRGIWGCYYDYVDRTTPTAIGSGFRPDQRWMADINSYADLQLNIISLFPPDPIPTPEPTPPSDIEARLTELEAKYDSLTKQKLDIKKMESIYNLSLDQLWK